jgi:hypothetical protein
MKPPSCPPPTPKEMRISARRFKVYTGVGSDLFRPHWFSWLSDPLLGKLAALLARVEGAGRWPGQVMTVLVHLIPKEGGGKEAHRTPREPGKMVGKAQGSRRPEVEVRARAALQLGRARPQR